MKSITSRNKELPKEGTLFTIVDLKSIHFGISGIVGHHDCKTRFYIFTGTSTISNIQP